MTRLTHRAYLLTLCVVLQAGAGNAAVSRVEDTDSTVSYVRKWTQGNLNRSWSGGTAAVSASRNARARLTFTGTGVRWIGFRGPQAGIGRVYLDASLVAIADAFAPEEEVGAVLYERADLPDTTHTLTIEVTGAQHPDGIPDSGYIVIDAFDVTMSSPMPGSTFAPGDVLVSIETGPVQWRRADGTLEAVLAPGVAGTGEGMDFDPAGLLYVSRWCSDADCLNGNTVERFDASGRSLGAFGSGYDCAPHAVVFDASGTAYVG